MEEKPIMFGILEKPDEPEPPQYKKGKPCLALVASDGQGVMLLDQIGAGLDFWFGECGTDPNDEFQDAPVGLSIWEGHLHSKPPGWFEEGICELRGDYRAITAEEWESYRVNGSFWNAADWFEQGPAEPAETDPPLEELIK